MKKLLLVLVLLGVSLPTFAAKAERIIALAPHAVEMLYTIGAGDLIVGTAEYSDYPEAAKAIPRVGGYNGINMEKVMSLEPDLIIAWESGNKAKDLEQLERLGFRIYFSKTDRITDIPKALLRLGEAVGREESAQASAQAFEKRLAEIKQANLAKPKVRFFYQLWLEPLKTLTAGSWINPVLTACGGENIFPEKGDMHYPQVSMESVLIQAPHAIVIPSHHGTLTASDEHWTAWPEIPAVKNQHIFYIDGNILHRYTTRILDGMEAVCQAFDKVRDHQSFNIHSPTNGEP